MTTALASKQAALNPLKAANAQDVLNRVLNEESTKDIAASFGVTRSALNYWLIEHCDTEWKAAQVVRAIKRKEDAEDATDKARTDLEALGDEINNETAPRTALILARLRACEAQLRSAQWDLERVCRRIYGQDAPPAGANAVQININLRGEPLPVVAEHGNVDDRTS